MDRTPNLVKNAHAKTRNKSKNENTRGRHKNILEIMSHQNQSKILPKAIKTKAENILNDESWKLKKFDVYLL